MSEAIWARMIVNSPCATSAAPTFRLCRGVKPPTTPAPYPAASFATSVSTTASATSQPTLSMRADVDREPEHEEEERREDVAEGEEALLDLLLTDVSARTTPAMSAPIASERPSSSAIAAIPTRKPNVARSKNSPGSRPSTASMRLAQNARRGHRDRDEDEGLARRRRASG